MSRVTPGVHLAMIGIKIPVVITDLIGIIIRNQIVLIGYMYRVPLGVLRVMIGIRSPVICGIITTNGIIRIVMMTNGTISGVNLAKTYGEVAVEVVSLVKMYGEMMDGKMTMIGKKLVAGIVITEVVRVVRAGGKKMVYILVRCGVRGLHALSSYH